MMSLTGKTALITGSTRGIGFATAQRLAKEGVHVYINANEDVSPAVEAIKASGGNASGVFADLSSAGGVASLIQLLPKVDILIHNLGIHSDHVVFWDSTDELYEEYFQANVMSGIRLCRHYLKHMIEKNEGRVVFVSSVLAKDPTPPEVLHQSICDAAKWTTTTALAQLTRNTNVTVNSIMPGGVATEGTKETFGQWFDTDEPPTPENMNRKMREAVPQQLIGRFIEPSEDKLDKDAAGDKSLLKGIEVWSLGSDLSPVHTSSRRKRWMNKKRSRTCKQRLRGRSRCLERVTVNCILPGGVATEGAKETFGEWFDTDEPPTPENMDKKIREACPQQLIGRFIKPSEVAGLIAYLCSEEAGAINGSTMNVDGGWCKH